MRAYVLSHFSHVQLLATLWTVACQAPLSLGFSRPEYWSGLPRPPPGDLPDQGLNPISYVSCIGRHSAAQIWLDSQHCPRTVYSQVQSAGAKVLGRSFCWCAESDVT